MSYRTAVVGLFAYNATMTLGASAIARPPRITNAGELHPPLLIMRGSLALAVGARLDQKETRAFGWRALLLASYPLFIGAVVLRW